MAIDAAIKFLKIVAKDQSYEKRRKWILILNTTEETVAFSRVDDEEEGLRKYDTLRTV